MSDGNVVRHPYFGVPPAREPRPARTVATLHGKRVILSTPEGFVYDMRSVSLVYAGPDGRDMVDIVSEEDYFRWMFIHEPPRPESFPARLVWVE